MHIHVDRIKQEGLALEFEETSQTFPVLTDMVDKGECEFLKPIRTRLRALKFDDMVEVEGNIDTSVRLTCGRCLQSFKTPLKSIFALAYKHRGPEAEETSSKREELELKAEDLGLIYYEGDEINLQSEIQEQVVMAFPLRALCKPDCRGLCRKCGADLNRGNCGCDLAPSGGKFAALKKLKLDKK